MLHLSVIAVALSVSGCVCVCVCRCSVYSWVGSVQDRYIQCLHENRLQYIHARGAYSAPRRTADCRVNKNLLTELCVLFEKCIA